MIVAQVNLVENGQTRIALDCSPNDPVIPNYVDAKIFQVECLSFLFIVNSIPSNPKDECKFQFLNYRSD